MNITRKVGISILILALSALTAGAQDGIGSNGQCIGDANGDGSVRVNELVLAVGNALDGCALRDIEINFAAAVGSESFTCGGIYEEMGTTGTTLRLADFRFYVSNVRLLTPAGDEVALDLEQDGLWQRDDLALLDFETGSPGCPVGNEPMNTSVRGTAPAGVYTGVRFDMGIPFDMNHGDAERAESPLNLTSMFWNWNGGYKFIRVDGFAGPVDGAISYNLHLGSTGCNGGAPPIPPSEECVNPNRPEITLNGFNPDTNVIVADLAAVLADADLEHNQMETAPGCQSQPFDMDCVTVFPKLGLAFGETPAEPQKLFRVE